MFITRLQTSLHLSGENICVKFCVGLAFPLKPPLASVLITDQTDYSQLAFAIEPHALPLNFPPIPLKFTLVYLLDSRAIILLRALRYSAILKGRTRQLWSGTWELWLALIAHAVNHADALYIG